MSFQALFFSPVRELYAPPDLDHAWPRHRALPDDLLGEEMSILLLRYGTHIVAEQRGVYERTLRCQFERLGRKVSTCLSSLHREFNLSFSPRA